MELFVFAVLVFVGLVFVVWRGRAGRSGPTGGLPDDLRDKNAGMLSLPNRGRPWGGGSGSGSGGSGGIGGSGG